MKSCLVCLLKGGYVCGVCRASICSNHVAVTLDVRRYLCLKCRGELVTHVDLQSLSMRVPAYKSIYDSWTKEERMKGF